MGVLATSDPDLAGPGYFTSLHTDQPRLQNDPGTVK